MDDQPTLRLEQDVQRGEPLTFTFDGQPLAAYEGETVAAALLAHGVRALRRTGRRGEARGVFCGMGICFECRMTIDGQPNVRACMTPVRPGLRVETQTDPPPVLPPEAPRGGP